MAIGDVGSSMRGSGARFNDGKPPVDLLMLRHLAHQLPHVGERGEQARGALTHLGMYQETHDPIYLQRVMSLIYLDKGIMQMIADKARVFAYGAKKYTAWNWAKGMPWSIPLACAARHLLAIYTGEENDPESGLPHAGHVGCNIHMLASYIDIYPEGNDLPALWVWR